MIALALVLLGFLVFTGVCYCIYLLIIANSQYKKLDQERWDKEQEQVLSLLKKNKKEKKDERVKKR